jgi:hypothetical protein
MTKCVTRARSLFVSSVNAGHYRSRFRTTVKRATSTNSTSCTLSSVTQGSLLTSTSVSQSDWIGGNSFYSNLEEGMSHHLFRTSIGFDVFSAGSYWFVCAYVLRWHACADISDRMPWFHTPCSPIIPKSAPKSKISLTLSLTTRIPLVGWVPRFLIPASLVFYGDGTTAILGVSFLTQRLQVPFLLWCYPNHRTRSFTSYSHCSSSAQICSACQYHVKEQSRNRGVDEHSLGRLCYFPAVVCSSSQVSNVRLMNIS